MDLRDLRYFETIAALEHVGKAAEQLHRTQPALTGAIRRLERAVDAPLFERSGRGIRLTSAGKVLLRWAQRIRFDIEDANREIAEVVKGLTGTVRLGVVPTAVQFFLPKAVSTLAVEAPDVTIKTTVGLINELRADLKNGALDLTIGTEGTKEPGFTSELLTKECVVVVAHPDHELFRSRPTLKDLTRYRWVLQSRGAPPRDWLDHTFDRYQLPRPTVQVESNMLLTLPMLIAGTSLLSFVSRPQLSGVHAQSLLKEVKLPQTTMVRRMVVTYRTNAYLSPASRRLLQLFRDAADPGAGSP